MKSYDNSQPRPGSRSYAPIQRVGARRVWPPDDTWTVGELAAELQFWRNLAALGQFARSPIPELRITPFVLPLPPAAIPEQRRSSDPRWDQFKRSALAAVARQERRRALRQRGHL